jgi:hypothetical protein
MLDGIFSFVLLDTRDNSYIVARDAIGVTSLYIGWGLDGNFIFYILSLNLIYGFFFSLYLNKFLNVFEFRFCLDFIRNERFE